MLRTVLALALLLAAVLVVLLAPWERPSPPAAAAREGDGAAQPEVAGAAVTAPDHVELARPVELERRSETPAVAPGEVAADAALVVVTGRAVDVAGAPLAGARVRLFGYQGWAEGHDVPRLAGRYDYRGFEATTGDDGVFRLEVPVPTVPRTMFAVEPDRFHDRYDLRFDGEQAPLLVAGTRDLGDLRLAATGAVTGTVRDEDGAPLADAKVSIGATRSTTLQRDVWTDADGAFVVAHAPVGTYGVGVRLEGYRTRFHEPVVVEAGRDAGPFELVLARAPTITGRVADDTGAPLEGVRLHGWPVGSGGQGLSGRSAADGTFTLYVPQDDPYTLSASLDGYLTWGDERDRTVTFEGGTEGLELVLPRLPKVRFTVVDAETGEPVERFGLSVLEGNGSEAPNHVYTERRAPPLADHPGGVAEATGRPGLDLYVVAAEGYRQATGDVDHPPGVPEQRIELHRGARLVGRVLRAGAPVADAALVLSRGTLREVGGREDVFRAYDERWRATSDADGRFELSGFSGWPLRLTVTPPTGAPLVRVLERLDGQGTTDLGDLELLPGAAVEGVVLLPPGVEPAGLTIYLDDWRDQRTQVTDAEGAFAFDELAPGVHTLLVGARQGALAGSEELAVELAPGERRRVELDARDHGVAAVDLSIELPGISPEGVQVDLLSAADPREDERLGNCDAEGRVQGHVRGWGETLVRVWLPGSRSLVHPDVRLDLRAGSEVVRHVRFELAEVRLTTTAAWPTDGQARLQLVPTDGGDGGQTARIRFRAGIVERDPLVRREGEALVVGGFLAGSYDVSLRLIAEGAEPELVPMEDGSYRIEEPAYHTASGRVTLPAGGTVDLALD